MAIEFRQLDYVIAANRHRSFRQAAASLQLKQSTLSRCILQLENELGVQLFVRHSGGVTPTSAGQDFLRVAERIAKEMDSLLTLAAAEASGKRGRLSIGFYGSPSSGPFAAAVREFTRVYPDVQLRPLERDRSQLLEDIQTGTLDCAIVSGTSGFAELQHRVLWQEELVVALPANHRCTGQQEVSLGDLRSDRFLLTLRDPGLEFSDWIMGQLATPGDRPHIEILDVSRESLLGFVASERGIMLATASTAAGSFPGVVYRGLHTSEGAAAMDQSVCWQTKNENPALQSFLRLLEA